MKIIIALALFLAFSRPCYSQHPLSKESIKDFAKAAYMTYRWEMYGFRIMVNRYFVGDLDKRVSDAAIAVESISSDSANRELILQSFDTQLTREEDVLFEYLHKMGMKANTAKEVTAYIRKKYPK